MDKLYFSLSANKMCPYLQSLKLFSWCQCPEPSMRWPVEFRPQYTCHGPHATGHHPALCSTGRPRKCSLWRDHCSRRKAVSKLFSWSKLRPRGRVMRLSMETCRRLLILEGTLGSSCGLENINKQI